MIDKRDCLHNKTFVVKNKRGDAYVYCEECFTRLRKALTDDLAIFKKRRTGKNGTH